MREKLKMNEDNLKEFHRYKLIDGGSIILHECVLNSNSLNNRFFEINWDFEPVSLFDERQQQKNNLKLKE